MIGPFKKKEEQKWTVKDGSRWINWTEGFFCETGFDGKAEWTPPSEEGNRSKNFSGLQIMRLAQVFCSSLHLLEAVKTMLTRPNKTTEVIIRGQW